MSKPVPTQKKRMSPFQQFATVLAALFAIAVCSLVSKTSAQTAKSQTTNEPANGLVTALWFSHLHAKPEALIPAKDRELKTTLFNAIRSKSPGISRDAVKDVFRNDDFQNLSGGKETITLQEMQKMLQDKTPSSRKGLFAKVRQHAELLTTQFDLIEERHREAADELVAWIGKNYRPGKPLGIIVVCTGNSRRSMLGSAMGNIAAAYYGLPDIHFYSGGTTPSALNSRTIATLKEIGVEIEPIGKEAPRGESGETNPIYRMSWGKGQECLEFSKLYSDAQNPQKDFAAIVVCSEADSECPTIKGAIKRISTPYMDPKLYDGAAFEGAKYAERRDDIGRFMLSVMMLSRRHLDIAQASKQ